jgi:hypothetical protein
MMAGIVVFIGFILLRLVLPTNWAFTIEATTEVVEVKMRPGTEVRWLVDGATVCYRAEVELPENYVVKVPENYVVKVPKNGAVKEPESDVVKELESDIGKELESDVVKLPDNPCGGSDWIGWRHPDADSEQVFRLNGGASATMQLRAQGGFEVSLRSSVDKSLGGYSVVGVDEADNVDDVDLGSKVNLIWAEVPEQSLTLPFSGETTLGRAVSWFDTRVLHSGKVVVYTADESADKRTMIDEADLMLGDQVRLAPPEHKPRWFAPQPPWPELERPWHKPPRRPWPKGFVYVTVEDDEHTMQVVAFGRAGSIGIERFGGSGYDFEPARIRALAADPAVAFWGSILAAYMTLILSLQPFVGSGSSDAEQPGNATDLLKRFNRWLRSRPK